MQVADYRQCVGCVDKDHTLRGGNRMRCLRTSLPCLADLSFCPASAPHSLVTQLFHFLMCDLEIRSHGTSSEWMVSHTAKKFMLLLGMRAPVWLTG